MADGCLGAPGWPFLMYRLLAPSGAGPSSSVPHGAGGICLPRPAPLRPWGPCLLAQHQPTLPGAFLMSQNRLGRKFGALVQLGARQCRSPGGGLPQHASSVWSSPLTPAPCSRCRRFPGMRAHEQCHTAGPGPGRQLSQSRVLLAKRLGSACSCAGWGQGPACSLGCQWGPMCSTTPWSWGKGLPQPLSCWRLPRSQPPTFLPPRHLCLPPLLVVLGQHHPIALQLPPLWGPLHSALTRLHTAARASTHGPNTADCCLSSPPWLHDILTAGSQGPSGTSPGQHHHKGTQVPPCGTLCAPAQCSAKHTGTSQTAGLTPSTTLLPRPSSVPAWARSSRPRAGFPPTAAKSRHGSSLWGHQDGPGHGWPWEGIQPHCSSTHASKGDTWTSYKNHRRFCTRTWGHEG